jgi:hypothetical protein
VIPVYLEVGAKRVFACVFDWPGWCRAGRSEEQALEALRSAGPRYAVVAREAGLKPPATEFEVVERLPGSATTDFGAPGAISKRDAGPLEPSEAQRLRKLVEAAWRVFDRVVAAAPAELRKGPRGGGRDRDKIVDHVLEAEGAYARMVGLRLKPPPRTDTTAISAFRAALLDALRSPPADAKWPPRYAARRIAWHALDHAWEIEERSDRQKLGRVPRPG